MIEIERKFLVKNNAFLSSFKNKKRIVQGYLNSNPKRAVRVRIKEEKAYITIKGLSSKNGKSRFEWEKEISTKDAENLLLLCEPGIIDKIRYEVEFKNQLFEVDVFEGENAGLILIEIELETETSKIIKPDWLGEEVTGDEKYYNSYLSKKPFSTW